MSPDNTCWTSNLAAWNESGVNWPFPPRIHDERVRVEDQRGTPVLQAGLEGRWCALNSGRNPVDEASAWLSSTLGDSQPPPILVVVGLGLGHLLDVLDSHAPATTVIAIEPNAALPTACLERRDCSRLFRDRRLIFVSPGEEAIASRLLKSFPLRGRASVMVNSAVARNLPAETLLAARKARDVAVGLCGNDEARRRFAPGYLLNTLANVPAIAAESDVQNLTGIFQSRPAVLVAAGPSLDANIKTLAALHERAIVIATDTALSPLQEAGVEPHIVVAVDPGASNAKHLSRARHAAPHTWLVAEASLGPEAVESFRNRTFFFEVSGHEPWPWLNGAGVRIGRLSAWGSVLTSAFDLACVLGCNPIVFAGADLAFTGGRLYARGTIYERQWAISVAAGHELPAVWQKSLSTRDLLTVPALEGGTTRTGPHFVSVRDWLAARCARMTDRRIVNGTGAGILTGTGIETASLTEVLEKAPALDGTREILGAVHARGVRPVAVAQRLSDAALDPAFPPPCWREITEGRHEELQRAVRQLQTGLQHRQAIEKTLGSLPRLNALDLAPDFQPEVVARLSTWLHGCPLPEWVDHRADHASHDDPLADPLELLGSALAAVQRPDATVGGGLVGTRPPIASGLTTDPAVLDAVSRFEIGLAKWSALASGRLPTNPYWTDRGRAGCRLANRCSAT